MFYKLSKYVRVERKDADTSIVKKKTRNKSNGTGTARKTGKQETTLDTDGLCSNDSRYEMDLLLTES